eukprot:765880-Pelagomonas_calceolata.AAC.1
MPGCGSSMCRSRGEQSQQQQQCRRASLQQMGKNRMKLHLINCNMCSFLDSTAAEEEEKQQHGSEPMEEEGSG